MGDGNNDHLQDDQEAEAEAVDTLSLTDFAISSEQDHEVSGSQEPPSTLSSPEFFEFFHGRSADSSEETIMCHAEDIIFCGKLMPINEQLQTPPQQPQLHKNQKQKQREQLKPVRCRRSESMSELKSTTTPSRLIRHSRSLDHKMLRRNSSMSSEQASEVRRNSSMKKVASSVSSSRWYVLMFGLVMKVPPEMDLQDIKNRQVRRSNTKSLFPCNSDSTGDGAPSTQGGDHRKSSWGVLGFLSCKGSASVAVTTPLHFLPGT